MKLLFVLHSAKRSGAEISLVRYASFLRSLNPTFVILENGPIAEDLRAQGFPVIIPFGEKVHANRSSNIIGVARSVLQLWRAGRRIRRLRADVVVAGSLKSLIMAVASNPCARTSIRVMWVHDHLSAAYLGKARALLARMCVRYASSGLIVNSRSTFVALGSPRRKTLLMPPAVCLSVTAADRRWRCEQRRRLIMVGRLAPWKGQSLLIDALSLMPHDLLESCDFLGGALFGEDEYERDLKRRVAIEDLHCKVRLLGHVDDVDQRLLDADVVVHASVLPEPFGAVVVEALAAGCIVVAADQGGPAEVIQPGVNGFLFEAGSARTLAARIAEACALSEENAGRMQSAAQATAESFDISLLGPQLAAWLASWTTGGPNDALAVGPDVMTLGR